VNDLIRALGRGSFVLFLFTAASGVMLAFYYQPSAPYQSVNDITFRIRFGWLMRSFHFWAANGLILLMTAHLLSGLLEGRYKEFKLRWLFGTLIGLAVLASAFTGSLLIWDQHAFWAMIIGTNIIDSTPMIGNVLKRFLLGGNACSQTTIHRFFVLHTLMLPAFLVPLLVWHMRSLGRSWNTPSYLLGTPVRVEGGKDATAEAMELETTARLLRGLMEVFGYLGLILILGVLFPAGIDKKANPLMTPEQIKPEWYFLFIYQGLKYVPKEVGSVLFLCVVPVAVTTLPLWDRSRYSRIRPAQRPVATALVGLVLLMVLGLTALGWLA
jgi:quinol-cytochrome oxidoreductase complex cytochrome b subunit